MMETICILAVLGLAACGAIIACRTGKKRKEKNDAAPPPLPPRLNRGTPSPIVGQTETLPRSSSAANIRPDRRSFAPATANVGGSNYGPRGLIPTRFPCCPFDKLRNVPGRQQVIFWDNRAGYYYCSRGHRFKSNGKLL